MHFENVDAVLGDHLEKVHSESRQHVCETKPSVLPVDHWSQGHTPELLKVGVDEFIGSSPQGN